MLLNPRTLRAPDRCAPAITGAWSRCAASTRADRCPLVMGRSVCWSRSTTMTSWAGAPARAPAPPGAAWPPTGPRLVVNNPTDAADASSANLVLNRIFAPCKKRRGRAPPPDDGPWGPRRDPINGPERREAIRRNPRRHPRIAFAIRHTKTGGRHLAAAALADKCDLHVY